MKFRKGPSYLEEIFTATISVNRRYTITNLVKMIVSLEKIIIVWSNKLNEWESKILLKNLDELIIINIKVKIISKNEISSICSSNFSFDAKLTT